METGAVSFKNNKLVKKLRIDRDREIVKKLNKTKVE